MQWGSFSGRCQQYFVGLRPASAAGLGIAFLISSYRRSLVINSLILVPPE
ncbi:hypothetical protein SLEP1_g41822 [Rubroshorea leprosula]|uniref:Uncharacterized protein n=1 Tax=Rubroshorea leprosula TaxID=152421 RepID=A0AAV5L7S0_9ROSI|nr:hypothetical protein SLEP1_g41822 [Rubroshorea leprosula]